MSESKRKSPGSFNGSDYNQALDDAMKKNDSFMQDLGPMTTVSSIERFALNEFALLKRAINALRK